MRSLSEMKQRFIKWINLVPVSSEIFGSPRKSVSVYEYAEKNPSEVLLNHTGENLELPPPKLNIDKVPKEFQRIQKRSPRQNFVMKITNGRVWGKNGAVISSNDQFLYDVSREFGIANPCKDHSVFHAIHLGPYKFVTGNVAVIATAGADVYYHWMLDVLPRILLLKEAGSFEEIDFFVLDYKALPFQKETLNKLGISEYKIIRSDHRKFHLKASCLFIPTLLSSLNQVNIFEIRLLQNFWLTHSQQQEPFRNLYISRRSANSRTIINETDLMPLLEKNNFEIIELENKSIEEQIKLYREARVIMGPHGSAFTNIIFAQPGAILIDIMPKTNIVPCFYNIAKQIGIEYFGFIGTSRSSNDNPKNDDIFLPREQFEIFIENKVTPLLKNHKL